MLRKIVDMRTIYDNPITLGTRVYLFSSHVEYPESKRNLIYKIQQTGPQAVCSGIMRILNTCEDFTCQSCLTPIEPTDAIYVCITIDGNKF